VLRLDPSLRLPHFGIILAAWRLPPARELPVTCHQ
jgi:hypothetical protein